MLDRTTPPQIHPFSWHQIPREEKEKLPNGITLHIQRGEGQEIGKMTILFEGGQYEEPFAPVAEATAMMLNEGAASFSGPEIADGFDIAGATFTSNAQAHHTSLSTILLSHRIGDVLPLFKSIIEAPHFSSEALESLKRTLSTRIRVERSKVLTQALEEFKKMIYGPEHPESRIETEENVERMSREDLVSFHRRLIKPETSHVFLAGGFGAPTIDAVKRFLMGITAVDPDCPGMKWNNVPMKSSAPRTNKVLCPNAVQTAIVAGMSGIERSHEDFINLRLTVMALGGFFGARLMSNIREEKGLTYGISSFLAAVGSTTSIQIQAQCKMDKTDQVLDEIRKELQLLHSRPPEKEELDRLKMHAMTNLLEQLDSPLKVSAYHQLKVTTGIPEDYFEAQQRAITSLSPEIISTMAQKYLSPDCLRISIAGNF